MVDGYILKIEDMNNAVKINSMMRQAEYEFAERVAEIIRTSTKMSWSNGQRIIFIRIFTVKS